MQYRTFAPRSQDTDPYTTLETYRLTRAAWFALYAPDAGRHDLLLADDVPSVYRNLFDAILDGNRGLARIAAAGGDELALLDVVARLPRPRQIPTRRLELPDNPDLAAALFGHVADELELDGLGAGPWPGMPQHTCAAAEAVGTVITFRGNRTSAARMFNPTWRTCPACRHLRARRIARQTLLTIGAHGPMTYAIMPAADFRKWTAAQRKQKQRAIDRARRANARAMLERIGRARIEEIEGQRYRVLSLKFEGRAIARANTNGATGKRHSAPLIIEYAPPAPTLLAGDMTHYRAMPQEGGAVFVVATGDPLADGAAVPVDRAALHTLMSDHCVTPDGKNCSSSHGFGGKYKRLRGDGRDDDRGRAAAVQRWTDSGLEAVAAALGASVRAGRDRFSVLVDEETARERLHLAGVALRDKKIVTHLVPGKRGKTCTKCVTETRAPSPIAPLLWPTESATAAQGGIQCATR